MNKSEVVFVFLISVLLINLSLISAGTLDEAKACLSDKISERTCSELSAEEQILSFLSLSQCEDELLANSRNNECWPLEGCIVKTTGQAVFALSSDTGDAINWLQTQAISPTELIWYLQIDTNGPSTCEITFDNQIKTVNIDEEKKLSSNAGACLITAYDDYWFEVEKNCYNKEISISCDNSFSTTLLYKKTTTNTIYLSGETQSAISDSSLTEKINSLCFGKNGFCDYESSLWTTLALKKKGIDVSPYVPYLVAMSDENERYVPESFLYLITGNSDYYNSVLLKQKTGYWEESGNRYYDTAVALLSLQNDNSLEKESAIDWLFQVQDNDGCWHGSLSETAFLIFSGWGSSPFSEIPSTSGTDEELETCSELGGEICSSSEECDSFEENSKNGPCCLGTCEKKPDSSISSDEYPDNVSGGRSYWYIWVLVILIILVATGIIFRNKIRILFFRIKSGFGKGSQTSTKPLPPRGPPSYSPPRPAIPRKIAAPSAGRYAPKPRTEMEKEFSDVLKKLKEIGG